MDMLKKWLAERTGDRERAQLREELAASVESQDSLMTVDTAMDMLKKCLAERTGDSGRAQLREELAASVESQDSLMMVDIAKVLHEMPKQSSVIAVRKYRGAVLAGLVVPHGDIALTIKIFSKGHLNPDGSPGAWRLIPETKLNLLKEFTDPPDAALAFFILTPTGQYALAFSHLVRSDGGVHWVSNADYICQVAEVLSEVDLIEGDPDSSAS